MTLFSLNIDNINLVKLLAYIKESNIIHHKVSGFGAMLKKDLVAHEEMSTLTNLRALSEMLVALTNNNGDGRIIIYYYKHDFVYLWPTRRVHEICHAHWSELVLGGGG